MTANALLKVVNLGIQDYETCWRAMTDFTNQRNPDTQDELWLVEHMPVFTQGQAGKAEHLLTPGDIPVVQSDRGGQVTYHGPGQLVAYPLLDLRRLKLGVRDLVSALEHIIIATLASYQIHAETKPNAPGVYVEGAKIASLGLRIRRGCSFHGVSINCDMDLAPFARINPCGYAGLQITQIKDLLSQPLTIAQPIPTITQVQASFVSEFARKLGYEPCTMASSNKSATYLLSKS